MDKYSYLKVDYFKVGSRSVKMLGFCTDAPRMRVCYPLGKQKLLDRAFPPKKKDLSLSLERKHRAEVIRTMREIIRPQVEDYKARWNDKVASLQGVEFSEHITCPLSGKNLLATRVDVDHVTPFIKLVEDWMKEESLSFSNITYNRKKTEFKDQDLQSSWYNYHLSNADLQLVEHKANLKKSDKGR